MSRMKGWAWFASSSPLPASRTTSRSAFFAEAGRWKLDALLRRPLKQRLHRHRLRATFVAVRIGHRLTAVHRDAGMLPFFVEDIEADVEVRFAALVEEALLDRVALDAAERGHAGVLRVGAAAHLFDDHEGTEIVE